MDYGEGAMLVNTGNPHSLAQKGSIGFDGVTEPVSRTIGLMNTTVLTDWFECPVTGLIGNDILLRCGPVKIDYKAGLLTTNYAGPEGEIIGGWLFGHPTHSVNILMDGNPYRCYVDTGSQYSYILPQMLNGKSACGRVVDFQWGVKGNRSTHDLFNTTIVCNDIEYEIGCCPLTPAEAGMIEHAGMIGILGKDFFDHHSIVFQGEIHASNYE